MVYHPAGKYSGLPIRLPTRSQNATGNRRNHHITEAHTHRGTQYDPHLEHTVDAHDSSVSSVMAMRCTLRYRVHGIKLPTNTTISTPWFKGATWIPLLDRDGMIQRARQSYL